MLVRNELWNDARVKKEARSLLAAGWRVSIVCRQEPGAPAVENWNGVRVVRPRYRSALTENLRRKADSAGGRGLAARLARAVRRNRVRRFLSDAFRNTMYELRLLGVLLREKASVYHANDLDTLLVCRLAATIRGARLVYDSHELWLGSARYLRETGRLGRLRDRLTERLLVGGCDAVIAVTPGRGAEMERMYPRMKPPLIVENCPEVTPRTERTGALRSLVGAGRDTPVILYQGIIAFERGLEQLVEAAWLLAGEGILLVIMGHDVTGGKIARMAADPTLGETLRVLPPVRSEDLPVYTADADAGLILFRNTCLNHYYSLPNKLYEYMMAGIPVIASDLPEIARVVKEGDFGLLIDPGDPAAIADAVRRAASDPSWRAAAGARARAAAERVHNWGEQEKVLLAAYEGLVRAGGPAR